MIFNMISTWDCYCIDIWVRNASSQSHISMLDLGWWIA